MRKDTKLLKDNLAQSDSMYKWPNIHINILVYKRIWLKMKIKMDVHFHMLMTGCEAYVITLDCIVKGYNLL